MEDDTAVDLDTIGENLWPPVVEEGQPGSELFDTMTDFEVMKVDAETVKRAIKREQALPDATLTVLLAAVAGKAWAQMESAAQLWLHFLREDAAYGQIRALGQLVGRFPNFELNRRNKEMEKMSKVVEKWFDIFKNQLTLYSKVEERLDSIAQNREDLVEDIVDIKASMSSVSSNVHAATTVLFFHLRKETKYYIHVCSEYVLNGESIVENMENGTSLH